MVVIIPMMALLVGGSFFWFNMIVSGGIKAQSEQLAIQQVYFNRSRTLQPLLQEIALTRIERYQAQAGGVDHLHDWFTSESSCRLFAWHLPKRIGHLKSICSKSRLRGCLDFQWSVVIHTRASPSGGKPASATPFLQPYMHLEFSRHVSTRAVPDTRHFF